MSKITFSPLKPLKIPERIIYGNVSKFNMADTKTGNWLGKMKVTPMTLNNSPFYKNTEPIKSLYINDLWIVPYLRRNNAGADFVKFAKHLSRQNDCNGRVYTLAYNYEAPGNAPHKFWRKMGFASTDPKENETLDFVIKNNLPVPPDLCQGTVMFLEI